MVVEGLEDRRLLAIAKFDFDSGTPETGPTGWTHIAAANASVGATDPSGIGIQFTGNAPIGYSATYVAGTVPADASGLRNGISRAVNADRVSFALTNLDPVKSYEVWVLGGNNAGSTQTQQVTVEGAQGIQSFTQTIPNLNVWVNSAVGDSTKAVTDFAPIFVQSPLHDDLDNNGTPETYVVRVAVIQTPGLTSAHAAGVIIRKFIPNFTLPASGGPFSLVAENGNRVVKNSGGAALATLPSTGPIIVNGTDAASDVLNVNLTSGNPLTGGVTFNGGAGGNDRLMLTGGSQGTATYNYTNANDGSIVLGNFGTVNYTGLEPIVNTGSATDVIFNLPASSDIAFLEDNGATPNDGMLRLRSSPTSFEQTDFATPGGSITVNLGAGNDTFTVSAVPQFNAALAINGGTGNDTINLSTSISFGSGKNLTIDLQDDDAAPGLDTINVGTGVALVLSGSGAATMKTSRGIAFAAASSLVTASGPILLAANQQATPSSGDFLGIDILGATIKSTSGDITLMGRGGTGLATQAGVYIHGLALIGDATTGAVSITGRGGNTPAGSSGGNSGVLVEDSSKVSTASSNISITGAGGTDAGNVGLNHGVIVDQSKVNAGAFGTLTITGTGTGPGSVGIQVAFGPEALKTVSGKMTLDGTGETGVFTNGAEIISSADIEITGTATSTSNPGIRQAGNLLAASSGNIKLIADRMDLQNSVDAGLGSVTLVTKTPGRPIDLGTDDSPAQLGILDVEQLVIAASTLNIGDASSGQITVSNNLARSPAAFVTNINLTSGGAIRFTSGLIDSAGGNVTLTPGVAATVSFAKTGTDLTVGAGTVNFGAGADASFTINGTAPDTQFQVLNVAGNVNLTGADLVLSGSHNPAFGATFAIIRYTGGRTGTFANATATLNGQSMTVVYDDANKQVLLRAPEPPSLSATLTGGDLTITDTNVAGKNNQLTVNAASGNLIITDAIESFTSAPAGGTLSNGNRTLTVPLASVTGSLIINAAGGNDLLTLDYSTGTISRPVTFNGGTQTTVPGDRLKLTGGSFTTVTHNFTNANSGTIDLDGASVTYTGLEPVDMGGTTATNLVLNLPAAASNAFLEDDGIASNGISQFRSNNATFETTTFNNPSGSLTINRGNAADTLTVNALPDFTAGLTIGSAAAPLGSVTFDGAVTLAANKVLLATATDTISLPNATSKLAASGSGGTITLATAKNISLSTGSSITSDANIFLRANQEATPTSGNFIGIRVDGATISSSSGLVNLIGRGGTFPSGQGGVLIVNAMVSGGEPGGTGINIAGTGGTTVANGANMGVQITGTATVTSTNNARILISGTGGTSPGGSNVGVLIAGAASILSGGGDVQISGVEGAGASGTAIWAMSGTISTASNGGSVALIGNSMSIGSTATISSSATSSVAIRPLTNGVPINLGLATDSIGGPLALTDAELDRITAGQVIIGDLNSGPVIFSAPISPANSATLSIITGGSINDTGATTVFTGTNFSLNAAAGIGTTSPLNIAVANLAASGGTLGVDISNTGNLAVTTLGGVGGATAVNSNVRITTAGSLTVDQPIAATTSGGIDLTAIGGSLTANAALTAGTFGVTLKADAGIQLATAAADITTSGPIDLNADFDFGANGSFSSATGAKVEQTGSDIPVIITASDVDLAGTLDSSGILILQPSTADRSIALNDTAGDFRLDAAEITRAGANNGGRYTIGRVGGTGEIQIGRSGSLQLPAGDFSILGGNVTFNGRLLMAATGPTLEIVSSGAIQQTFSGNAIQGATTLILDSANGIGALTNPLRVAAGQSLAARASVNGPVAIASTDSLTSRALGSINGITTNGGPIQLEAFNFRVGLTGVGLGPINAGAGSVSITATAPTFNTTGSLTINDAVTGGADSTLTADSLFLNSTGSVNVGTAKLTIAQNSGLPIDLGGPDVSGVALGLTNDELDRIVAGTLVIGDIPFGGQITITTPINVADNATPIPTLHLASVGGIIDASAAGPDLTVANLALEAFSGDDISNLLTTQANTLSASYVSAGDILISNIGALNIVTQQGLIGVRNNGGDVAVTAAGPLTVTSSTGSAFGETILMAAGDDQLLTLDAIVGGQGNSTYLADKMVLTGNLGSSFGTTIIAPESNADSGDAIHIGTTSAAPDVLSLTDADWFISGEPIQIGDANSGPITVTGNFAPFPSSDFHLVSSGAINFTGGSFNTGGGDLLLSPGEFASVGVAKAGNDVNVGPNHVLAFAPGSDLAIAINGTTVDTQYHQLNVAGQIDLTGVDLAVTLGFSPPVGSNFTIVANDGAEAVIGAFNGLPDASLFFIGSGPQSRLAQISYFGGDGNDVVLNVIDPTDPSLSGTSGDDSFLVRRVAGDVEILLNGASLLATPFVSLTRIRLDSLAGNDTLTVDLTGGDPIPAGGIHFTGGAPTTAPGDSLIIAGGAQGTVSYNYTSASDGSVVMSNFGTVTYTGLEPILNTGTATDVIFNLPAGTNTVTLGDDGTPANGLSRLTGPTIETATFANPSGSLTINRGSASDSLTINSLPDFNASLSIGSAAAPLASVLISGTVNFATNKSFSVHASGSITLSDAASDLAASGTGSINLTAARNISLATGSSLTVVNGNLTLIANQQNPPTTGDFVGVLVSGATVQSTGSGQVNIFGRGGTSASGGQLFGILVNSGGQVRAGTSGVRMEGTGGDSNGSVKSGVRLTDAALATGANVLIIGTGGAGGEFNRGVELFGGALISGGGGGEVLVFGTGGLAPGNENQGVLVNGAGTAITGLGDVTIDGAGGGTGASVFNGGVVAVNGGSFRAGGGGALQITGRAGNEETASNGVSLLNVTTGGGNITIAGIPANAAALSVNLAGSIAPGPGGNVLLLADRLNIAAAGSISAPLQTVTILTNSENVTIDLGGADSATTLGLTDAELDAVTANILEIGDFLAGPINITADITRPAFTNVSLASGSSINFLTGSLNTAGGGVLLAPDPSAEVTVANDANDVNMAPGGTLFFASGADLLFNLDGPTPDTEYDQLNVAGSIDLTDVDLFLSLPPGLPGGSQFVIVNNDGVDPVTGRFNGLPDGQVFALVPDPDFPLFQISYIGGDGNDVVLTAIDPRNPQLAGTAGDDNFLVKRNADALEVSLNGTLIFTNAFAAVNFLLLDGLAGNDTLTVDLTAGDAVPDGAGISFIGGVNTATGDKLTILGGNQGNVSYFYDTLPTGLVNMSSFGPINFLELESILNTGAATDATINLFGPGSSFTLADDGIIANNLSRISGPNILPTDFTNPTNSLTINPGNPADSLTINSLPDFNSSLTIGSPDSAFGTITFAGAVTLAAHRSLAAHAIGDIHALDTTSDLTVSGTGGISLVSARQVAVGPGASITTVDGPLRLEANQQSVPTDGTFSSIVVTGGLVQSTGAGAITIKGKGGTGAAANVGVVVQEGGKILGGTAGTVLVQGTGGDGPGPLNIGVSVAFGPGSEIGSIGADIHLIGQGGGSGSGNSNVGVNLNFDATIAAGGSGAVLIEGTGGSSTGNSNHGISLIESGITSANGPITLIGHEGPIGIAIVINVNSQVTTGANADLTLIGDRISISGPTPGGETVVSAGTGTVVLRPRTIGRNIKLGESDSSTQLGLTDAELDRVTAGTLQIGDSNSGAIIIDENISRSVSTISNLTSSSFIIFESGSFDTGGGDLTLTHGNPASILVPQPGNDVAVGANGTLRFANASFLGIRINGTEVDTQHEQLNVVGKVDLSGVTASFGGLFAPAIGDQFVIINNDGTDAVIGTFNGLDNGDVFTIPFDSIQGDYQIVYTGGDGNDVVLTAVNAAPSFLPGIVPPANDESGLVSVPFATQISTGPPREATQNPIFQLLDLTNGNLFAVPPAIDQNGVLTFTPNFNVAGRALLTIALKDDGGTANGGSDTSDPVTFTIDITKKRVWYNAKIRLDVTGDNFRTADDALAVINFLNAFSTQPVPTDGRPIGPYYDTDGNGTVTANDALDVINFLNAFGADTTPAGEGEPLSSSPLATSHQPPALSSDLLTLLATDLATQPKRRR